MTPPSITSYIKTYEILTVLLGKKEYTYYNVSPHQFEKLSRLLRRKNHKAFFSLLGRFSQADRRVYDDTPY